jgi:hypothetical protein
MSQFATRNRSPLGWKMLVMRPISLLLVIPFVAVLWVPFFNFDAPRLYGIPFFYWYQMLWIPLTSLIIYIVFRKVRDDA